MKKLPITTIIILAMFTGILALYLIMNPSNPNKINNLAYVQIDSGGQQLELELKVATTPAEIQQGLMYKAESEIGDGMLFIFPDSQPRTFWMKNTITSLDILFLDSDFRLINFYENTKTNQTSEVYASLKPAKYVIELVSGSIKRLGISLDSKFELR